MALDFAAVREGRLSYVDAVGNVTPAALRTATADLYSTIEGIIAGLSDDEVVFQPVDPDAHDQFAAEGVDADIAWTLGHVIVHLTAGLEENAALGTTLARGVRPEGRSRYETPWESVHTAAQIRQRLTESRRISLAFLDAWPDVPHLDLTVEPIPSLGPLNAVGLTGLGLLHAASHLEQLREIRRQAAIGEPAMAS